MRKLLASLLICLSLLCTQCKRESGGILRESTPNGVSPIRVAVLLAPSGKGDHSYNDMALQGLVDAHKSVNFSFSEILPPKPADYEAIIRKIGEEKYSLIVGVGFLYTDSFKVMAPRLSETKFLLLDGDAGPIGNVRSVMFRPEEGCFLVGSIAAAKTKTGKVGFIAGMDIPIMHRFECGFRGGVARASHDQGKKVIVETRYIGSTPDAFSNASKGRQIASLMFENGVDVVFHAAGRSGNGVIQAAQEMGKSAIGVDSDQSYLAPQAVITSMRKRLDRFISKAIIDVASSSFRGGTVEVGLKEGGVDYVVTQATHVEPDLRRYVDSLAKEVASGSVKPCPEVVK